MARFVPRRIDMLARLALVALIASTLASCSGAVGSPPTTPTVAPITVTPSSATLFSDLPTTFTVTGGTGSYIITSDNQAVVPSIPSLQAGSFTVVPAEVASDTNLTLTVQDTGSNSPATASLVVKPRTVSNVVTITPSASQSAACGTSICSGGDATVTVVLSQAGVPLVGRVVRFDVVSGDFRIITSDPGLPETLSLSGTATTGSNGAASIRIRALADAMAETALLQITDVSSGFTQRTIVSIAPSSNAPLNAQPSTIVFQGVDAGTCAGNTPENRISADVIVFGGRPPYLISQPGSFTVNPTVVTSNGGRFTVTAIGQCTSGSQIAVVDANGATVSVTASNKLSDLPIIITPTTTAFTVSPVPVTTPLASCTDAINFTLSGGSGSYIGASSSSAVTVTINSNLASVRRTSPSPSAPSSVTITFSDGKSSILVPVPIATSGMGLCT